jgi:hypothetical protein
MSKCYYSPLFTTNLLVGAYYRVQRLLQLKIETDLTKKRLMERRKVNDCRTLAEHRGT